MIGPTIGAAVLKDAEVIVGADGTTSFIPNETIFLAALAVAVLIWLALAPLLRKTQA